MKFYKVNVVNQSLLSINKKYAINENNITSIIDKVIRLNTILFNAITPVEPFTTSGDMEGVDLQGLFNIDLVESINLKKLNKSASISSESIIYIREKDVPSEGCIILQYFKLKGGHSINLILTSDLFNDLIERNDSDFHKPALLTEDGLDIITEDEETIIY